MDVKITGIQIHTTSKRLCKQNMIARSENVHSSKMYFVSQTVLKLVNCPVHSLLKPSAAFALQFFEEEHLYILRNLHPFKSEEETSVAHIHAVCFLRNTL